MKSSRSNSDRIQYRLNNHRLKHIYIYIYRSLFALRSEQTPRSSSLITLQEEVQRRRANSNVCYVVLIGLEPCVRSRCHPFEPIARSLPLPREQSFATSKLPCASSKRRGNCYRNSNCAASSSVKKSPPLRNEYLLSARKPRVKPV